MLHCVGVYEEGAFYSTLLLFSIFCFFLLSEEYKETVVIYICFLIVQCVVWIFLLNDCLTTLTVAKPKYNYVCLFSIPFSISIYSVSEKRTVSCVTEMFVFV